MLEQQQQVGGQAAGDPVRGEPALPFQGFTVGHEARANDFEHAVAHRPPAPGAPLAACTAHRLPAMPRARLAPPPSVSPMAPPSRNAPSARNPTIRVPTADNTAITPRCHTFSIGRLRRQPKNAANTTPARRPASSGSPTIP